LTIQEILNITTEGRGIYDITERLKSVIAKHEVHTGLCHLFCRHTSASLILCENYDADVKVDIEMYLSALIQDGDPRFTHILEGKDDMAAHLRTLLTQSELTLPLLNRQLGLGTWQGVCLYEHRYAGQQRQVILTLLGGSNGA